MNIPKLKGKMVEMCYTVESLSAAMGIDKSTFYRKMECIEKFSVGEAQKIKDVLQLSIEEFLAIFFN
jgi:hypothetical protein